MMKHSSSIDRHAAADARRARQELAALKRDMQALHDHLSGLTRGIKAAQPKGGKRYFATSRHAPSLLDNLGNFAAQNILGEFGVASASQRASSLLNLIQQAQRIN